MQRSHAVLASVVAAGALPATPEFPVAVIAAVGVAAAITGATSRARLSHVTRRGHRGGRLGSETLSQIGRPAGYDIGTRHIDGSRHEDHREYEKSQNRSHREHLPRAY